MTSYALQRHLVWRTQAAWANKIFLLVINVESVLKSFTFKNNVLLTKGNDEIVHVVSLLSSNGL